MSTIGHRITVLRQLRGMSGAALARKIGIKQPSLWELENKAGAEPSGRVLANLCATLRTTPEYIMDGAANPDDLELEMEAAEILYAFRHLDDAGRAALVATARGLMAAANPSASDPFKRAKKPPIATQ